MILIDTNLVNNKKSHLKSILPELIAKFIVFLAILNVPYMLLAMVLILNDVNDIIATLFQGLYNGLATFIAWKITISTTLKNKTFSKDEISKLFLYMILLTLTYCILSSFNTLQLSTATYDEYIENDYSIKHSETIMESLYSDEYMNSYQTEKNKIISDEKQEVTKYLIFNSIFITICVTSATVLQKKTLTKYIV